VSAPVGAPASADYKASSFTKEPPVELSHMRWMNKFVDFERCKFHFANFLLKSWNKVLLWGLQVSKQLIFRESITLVLWTIPRNQNRQENWFGKVIWISANFIAKRIWQPVTLSSNRNQISWLCYNFDEKTKNVFITSQLSVVQMYSTQVHN